MSTPIYVPTRSVVCCVFTRLIDEKPRVLIMQRRPNQTFPLKWTIPGGKVNTGERLHKAASREAHEELGVSATFEPRAVTTRRFLDTEHNTMWDLHYMLALEWTGTVQNLDGHDLRWACRDDIEELASEFLVDDLVVARQLLA